MIGDRAASLLDLLRRVNRDVVSALDLRIVLQRLVLAAVQHVGGERASIIIVGEDSAPVDAIIAYGATLHEHTTGQLRETLERGLAGWVIRNRKPALVPDTSADPRWLRRPDDAPERTGSKSAVCVPLIARDETVGALTIVHTVPDALNAQHFELAQALADQASIAVLNARLYGESTRRARIMTALVESAAAFGAALSPQEVWERVLNHTLRILNAETAALGMLEPSDGQVVFHAAAGTNSAGLVGQHRSASHGLVARVLQEGRAILISHPELHPSYTEVDRFREINARALVASPIYGREAPIGVIVAFNPSSRTFDPDATALMQGLGGLAGAAIQNAQLQQRLRTGRQRYLELFEESIDLVFVTTWDGTITEANRRAEEVTGLAEDQLQAMRIGQLHSIDWNLAGRDLEVLKRQGSIRYESGVRSAEGRLVPVEAHARRIELAGGDGILWTLHDQTERKELDSLRQNLEAMIYHDLRSPLSNLRSSLDLLHGIGEADEDIRATLEIAERSAERMSRLMRSLLDINRLEAGQSVTTRTACSPRELVESAVRDAAPLASARQHVIESVLSAGLPEIRVDGDMLRRVFINLLENAIKYSQSRGRIEIGARKAGAELEFWIQDEGPGIPKEQQARIFQKFARQNAAEAAAGGLGLGLAFCQLAVEAHGGSIRVESTAGNGSRFIVLLPASTLEV